MLSKKGLTILEIIIVFFIVGVLVAIAIPGYGIYVFNGKVQNVENNLRTMGAAEQKYYEDHNSTYYDSANFGLLNSNLSISLEQVNDGFTYSCTAGACTAVSAAAGMTVSVATNGTLTCSTGTCP